MNTRPLEALSWAATLLALGFAALAYTDIQRKDAEALRVRRNGVLAAIATELGVVKAWVTGWRDEFVQNPPPQWLDPLYTVFPFPYEAIIEAVLRGPELRFEDALVERLAVLRQVALVSRNFAEVQRQFVYSKTDLAISIKRKQIASASTGERRLPLTPEETIFLQFHLSLHQQLTRGGLSPLGDALNEVPELIARERQRVIQPWFLLGKFKHMTRFLAPVIVIVSIIGAVGTVYYLCLVVRHALHSVTAILTRARKYGRSLLTHTRRLARSLLKQRH